MTAGFATGGREGGDNGATLHTRFELKQQNIFVYSFFTHFVVVFSTSLNAPGHPHLIPTTPHRIRSQRQRRTPALAPARDLALRTNAPIQLFLMSFAVCYAFRSPASHEK